MPHWNMLLRPIDALLANLTHPVRGDRYVLGALAAYVALWTVFGVVAKSSQSIHYDSAEVIAWSRELAFGYPKHPPFAAWLTRGWFSIFPVSDWAYYLLAMASAAVALWFAWLILARYCSPEKRVLGLAVLCLIPFYNFHALKFDHTTVLLPLWASTTFWFLRSFETRKPSWAALAGIGAAATMLAKYWSIYLLAGLALAALFDQRRQLYFRSIAPWITTTIGALVLAPHLAWLIGSDFSPMSYAVSAHELRSFKATLASVVGYLAGSAGYVAVPVLLVLAASRPTVSAMRDVLFPQPSDRRFAAVAFWVPMLLPAVIALATGLELNSMWSMASLSLLPVVLLSSPLIVVGPMATRAMVALAVILPVLMCLAAPWIAIFNHRAGVIGPGAAHGRLLAEQLEQDWKQTTSRPLRLVGGDLDLAYVTAFYVDEKPSVALVAEPHLSPWVDQARIDQEGIAMACYARDDLQGGETCVHKPVIEAMQALASRGPPGRRVVVELARSYLGMAGKPTRYIIMTIPPRP
jgi:4-amino-4-deoxy-L-arabinose transferase-like glycosyltransferase